MFLLFFFKSGPSGKPGRPRQNARVRVEEIVAYRTFGVAETFLGHQVNASTAACFTCSLNYILLPHLGPTETAGNRRSKWESTRIDSHWGSNATRYTSLSANVLRGIHLSSSRESSAMTLADWINHNWIHINKSIFFNREISKTLTREVKKAYRCPTCTASFFRWQIAQLIRSRFFLNRNVVLQLIIKNKKFLAN